MLLSHEDLYFFLLLIALANCTHLLSTCLASKNSVLYSEGKAYKRAPELVTSPQSTALHSTGTVKNSVSKNEVGHNSTRGIVSLFLFFPAELLLHKVYIFNILCGLRLWVQEIYSKKKPSLALFISTSNEHILDKTMVKIHGLMGTVSRDFLLLVFFMNQFPPSPWVYHLGRFKFFRKLAEIFAAQGWPPVSATPVANLPPMSTTPVAKLPPVSTTPVANLPPVSTTPAANCATSFTSVVDTGGKFATGVVDTGGKQWE